MAQRAKVTSTDEIIEEILRQSSTIREHVTMTPFERSVLRYTVRREAIEKMMKKTP